MDLKKFLQVKQTLEDLQRESAKSDGVLQQLMKQLRQSFGCKSKEQGQVKLEGLLKQKEELKQEYEVALRKFEKKWGDKI